MDYEKEYKEAFKRAERRFDPNPADGYAGYANGIIEDIFPQFIKREDERIRKTLIEALKTSKTVGELKFILPEPTREEALAYLEKQKEPENISASTMIPSFHEELTEFELVLFNAVLDNNFVGAKGSENALAMTKKVAPQLLAIAKKEPDWDREKCFVCQEYEKGFKQGHLEGCTAGYNKAMKEVDEQKEPNYIKHNALFDECVKNCNPEVMKKVSDEINEMLQKEQKPFNVCEQCPYYKDCPNYNEQKPTECIDFDNEFENQISHLIASILNGEHEYNEGFIKYATQSLLGYAKNEIKPDELDKREKLFTKALQTANARIGQLFEENQKLKEQKPTEWSEEDAEMFTNVAASLRVYACGLESEEYKRHIKKEIDWFENRFKSLRPQPHWKPSKEQIDALNSALADIIRFSKRGGLQVEFENEPYYMALHSLYEQLKKLM